MGKRRTKQEQERLEAAGRELLLKTISKSIECCENAPSFDANRVFSVVVSGVSDSDVEQICLCLKNLEEKNPDFIWYVSDSTTALKNTYKQVDGKTQKIVRAKVPRHLHIIIGSETADGESELKEKKVVIDTISSLRSLSDGRMKHPRSKKISNGLYYYRYCFEQADKSYSDTHFNWGYFSNIYYLGPDELDWQHYVVNNIDKNIEWEEVTPELMRKYNPSEYGFEECPF